MAVICFCVCTPFILPVVLWGGYYWLPLCDLRFPCGASSSRATRTAGGSRDRKGMAGWEARLGLSPIVPNPSWPWPAGSSAAGSPWRPQGPPWDRGSLCVLCGGFLCGPGRGKETGSLRSGLGSSSCIRERRFFCWPLYIYLTPTLVPVLKSVAQP